MVGQGISCPHWRGSEKRRAYLAEVERLLLLEMWPRPLLPEGDGS